jgi:excisionase family DNA binding protein
MATDVHAPRLLTVREVADRLQLSEKSVRRRIASGELPAVQLGDPARSFASMSASSTSTSTGTRHESARASEDRRR